MYRITEIALPLDGQEQELRALAAKRLHVEPERVCALSLVKKVGGRTEEKRRPLYLYGRV